MLARDAMMALAAREDEAAVIDPAVVSSSSQGRARAPRRVGGVFFDERDGPLPALLLTFTLVAGVIDAISILRLGHVFVAVITGNLLFLGLAAAGAKGFSVVTCALALAGFIVGVLIGGQRCRCARHRGWALRNVLAVKLCLASAVTLIAIFSGPHLPVGASHAMVVLLATSMGAQLAAIRYLKVPDLLTVVLTLTLTGALTERPSGWNDPKMLRRGLALVAFAVGALSGGLLILNVGLVAALLLGLGILVAVTIATQLLSRGSPSWTKPRSA